jgi:glycosyltransferase involved in cell wall biosynthesis
MRFSVVIPVYNVAEYLRGCVNSILANDCSDCEIILVDDGATDGICPALCDEIAAEHPNLIRVIHQENQGLGGARNTGLEAARGEYLFFVDSDDTIVPDALSKLDRAICESGADIVAFNLYSDDGEGGLTPIRANAFLAERKFSLKERPEFLLSLPSAWSRVWKRELFVKSGVRYPSRVWYEDIRTSTKLFALADSIYTIDDCLYRYLQRAGSIMNSGRVERNGEILDAFDDILTWFEAQGLRKTYEDELTRLAIDHIVLAASVRVARMDPRHALLEKFRVYMQENFPSYQENPYVSGLSKLHKLLLTLVKGKNYRMIQLLFRLKNGR